MAKLNVFQTENLNRQIEEHNHDNYFVDIKITDSFSLKHFAVHKNVLRPDKSLIARSASKYLAENPLLYRDKLALDMGCGSGIIGITMALNGAKKVVLSDIEINAFDNSLANILQYKLDKSVSLLRGDLFSNISGSYDLIVFNHPLYPTKPIEGKPITIAICDDGNLLKRFLRDANKHLNKDGVILLPFHTVGGKANDPRSYIEDAGYTAEIATKFDLGQSVDKWISAGLLKLFLKGE